jgi:drug/metabolite transporter (DMT)-like permease
MILLALGQQVHRASFAGAAMGFGGIYLLVVPPGVQGFNRGDIYTLLCSLCFAIHIILVGFYNQRHSFRDLAPLQILITATLAFAVLPLDHDHYVHYTVRLGAALLFTAIFSTAFAFSVQNWAQRYTPPAHAALIFALEPVFAALFSFLFRGERLGGKALWGSVLILAGMLISELWGGSSPMSVER